jgi:hypothetical protein
MGTISLAEKHPINQVPDVLLQYYHAPHLVLKPSHFPAFAVAAFHELRGFF